MRGAVTPRLDWQGGLALACESALHHPQNKLLFAQSYSTVQYSIKCERDKMRTLSEALKIRNSIERSFWHSTVQAQPEAPEVLMSPLSARSSGKIHPKCPAVLIAPYLVSTEGGGPFHSCRKHWPSLHKVPGTQKVRTRSFIQLAGSHSDSKSFRRNSSLLRNIPHEEKDALESYVCPWCLVHVVDRTAASGAICCPIQPILEVWASRQSSLSIPRRGINSRLRYPLTNFQPLG